jgi:hypothetical protein
VSSRCDRRRDRDGFTRCTGASFLEDIDGPVPAAGHLDRHLWLESRLGHGQCNGHWILPIRTTPFFGILVLATIGDRNDADRSQRTSAPPALPLRIGCVYRDPSLPLGPFFADGDQPPLAASFESAAAIAGADRRRPRGIGPFIAS